MESAKKIYLDNAAGTPIDPEVFSSMLPYFDPKYSNPSSLHSSGRLARNVIEQSRIVVAQIIQAKPEEIIFTGSGTESDNLAILGTAHANRSSGNHVIISSIEHKAVLESAKQLENEGFVVSILPVDTYGKIHVDECLKIIRPDTILISVMYANNEIGTIQPIHELAETIKKYRGDKHFPLLHTDACQAAGFLPLGVDRLGVDMMTLNGSKIYGPKGIGVLYKRKHVKIQPVIVGGDQEMHFRAGTENIALVVGFATALKISDENRKIESKRLTKLRDYFISELQKRIPNIILNGHTTERLPNNIHVSIPYIEGESILLMLDKYGIEISTGSACSASDLKASHVLRAIGQTAELAHGSIRFSLGKNTTTTELNQVLTVFPKIVEHLSQISALNSQIQKI